VGIASQDVAQLDDLVTRRARVARGDALFATGEKTGDLYAIRSGSLKTQLEDANGRVQITGFFLPGEIVGMDGLVATHQFSRALALEDTEVCLIGIDELNRLSARIPTLHQQFQRLMSQEIQRSHLMAMSLGALRSDQRLAVFLLNFSQRLARLGYSATRFVLRMSREEIGNYLGLTLETVSRLFSKFARDGLIKVRQRDICLTDVPTLNQLAGIDCCRL
jgi:CRP/FNR family transcriptional regulator